MGTKINFNDGIFDYGRISSFSQFIMTTGEYSSIMAEPTRPLKTFVHSYKKLKWAGDPFPKIHTYITTNPGLPSPNQTV